MAYQSEQELENALIAQLVQQGFERVTIKDDKALEANLKTQLEKVNHCSFSDAEFKQVLSTLAQGNIFAKAKALRDHLDIALDNGDSKHIRLLFSDPKQNSFQVTHQVTIRGGVYENRYDVTVLVNGLPLVQIELKRRGSELKEAFNQVVRYQKHSYHANHRLFNYIQLFVISNGVNSRYFANNSELSFKQVFDWTSIDNQRISQLDAFAEHFLTVSHLTSMLTKYIVMNETNKCLMVLRPYQFYAVEAILHQVKTSTENGYVWHTTGSGKTLTSFKTAQLVTALSDIDKVLFVVDRKDLDYQTAEEFNAFAKGCVDSTDNTRVLFHQLLDKPIKGKEINKNRNTKLVVTTLQKLNNVISKKRYLAEMEKLRDKRIVFIFDECHRSQFGETHKTIINFFHRAQLFGFTGTPIFAENAVSKKSVKKTTADLFGRRLHSYVIVDAIRDRNVLQFNIEYVGRYKHKQDSKNYIDIEVEDIDTKELLSSPARLEKIVDYILAHHKRKTQNAKFNAMFCVAGLDELIAYYELFAKKKAQGRHNLKIGTIFSYEANGDMDYELGISDDVEGIKDRAGQYNNKGESIRLHAREKLDSYINDYNQMFGTNYSTKDSQSFYKYYQNISKRTKDKELDILLVVNMFLTGFDAKSLNTIYVDKNLKHHGLVQAFSRTNRILNEAKCHGNVVCFRNLKKAADEAFILFSNKEPIEHIITPEFDDLLADFNQAIAKLKAFTAQPNDVDTLADEKAQRQFVLLFRTLMQLKNKLENYADFDITRTVITDQEYQDYASKYADLSRDIRGKGKEKVSILDDVDFELELLHRDEVNVAYILHLLKELTKESSKESAAKKKQSILNLISSDPTLLSKKALIEKFITEHLDGIPEKSSVEEEFQFFWEREREEAIDKMATEEQLDKDKLEILFNRFQQSQEMPLRDDLAATLTIKPTLLQRKKLIERISDKFKDLAETFLSGW